MKLIMNMLMVSCKQAALLGAKQDFHRLSPWEKAKLKMHVKMCTACKTFGQESQLMDKALERILEKKDDEPIKLTKEQRLRILEVLKQGDY